MTFGLETYDSLGRLSMSLKDSASLPVLSLDIALPPYLTWPLIPPSHSFRRHRIATVQNYDDGKHFAIVHFSNPGSLLYRTQMRVYLEGNFIYVLITATGGSINIVLQYHTVRITVMQVAL